MNLSTTGLSLAAHSAIDLHLHTIYSDGRWNPEQLLDHLVNEQFDLVAITDHDRTDTVAAIQQLALEKHLPVLVGVEMTSEWKGEMTDLLCYGFDPDHNALSDLTRDLLHRQQGNTREVFENLQRQGYFLPAEALPLLLAKPSAEQPHAIVALLREHGFGLDEPSAGQLVMQAGCTFETTAPAAVVEAAHQSGCVCVLAHPGQKDGFVTYSVELLDQFRHEAPIDGLEVYHRVHSPAQTEMYREYTRREHLLISAGSDSHKPEKPPIKYRAELCCELLERVGIRLA